MGQEIEESCRYTAPERYPLILLTGQAEKLYPQTPVTVRRTGKGNARSRLSITGGLACYFRAACHSSEIDGKIEMELCTPTTRVRTVSEIPALPIMSYQGLAHQGTLLNLKGSAGYRIARA